MKLTLDTLHDPTKMAFVMEALPHLKSLEIQYERICDPLSKFAVQDAEYYLILLRRLYRQIEKYASQDSRVLVATLNPLLHR